MSEPESSAALVAHRLTPAPLVSSITAEVARSHGILSLHFVLRGRVAQLAIPQPAQSERTDELWRHTCFEAFLARPDEAGYHEINLSPSRQWAIYRFDDYRSGMRGAPDARVQDIVAQQSDDEVRLSAQIVFDDAALVASDWQLALSAVVEDGGGAISYWALAHPAERADFHRREGFTLLLDSGFRRNDE